jgi:hypothetical protein
MIDRALLYFRLHPIKGLAAALSVVLFVAIAMGIYRKTAATPEASPTTAIVSIAETASGSDASPVDEAPEVIPATPRAPPKPASLPPVAPIDAAVVSAARESWSVATDSSSKTVANAQYARVGGGRIAEALAVFDWPRAWGPETGGRKRPQGYVRYRREGWIRVDTEGLHTATLSIDSTTQVGGTCRLAVGDLVVPTIVSRIQDGLEAGIVTLRPGYYPAALECTYSTNLARKFFVQAALMPPGGDQPEILRFFESAVADGAGQ